MKYIILIITLTFTSLFGYTNNWERVKYSGTVVSNVIADSNYIYCLTEGGFYKNQNSDNWQALNNNQIAQLLDISSFSQIGNQIDVQLFIINNQFFIFNKINNKLIYSIDKGSNWTFVSLPNITSPYHFFNFKNVLYIQSDADYSSLYYLKNNVWNKLITPLKTGKLSALNNKILNSFNTNDFDNGFSIGDSLFNFNDYTLKGLPLTSYHVINYYDTVFYYDIAAVYSFNNNYYVTSSNGEIYKSHNNEKWVLINTGLPSNISYINKLYYISDTMFLDLTTNKHLIYYSINNGATWLKNKSNILPELKFNDEYYAIENGKLIKSNFIDSNWTVSLDSIYASNIYNLQSINEFIFFQDYSINRPVRYNTVKNEFVTINTIDLHDNKIYAINDTNKMKLFLTAGYKLYYSIDTGINWSVINLLPFISKTHNILSSNKNEIIFKASDINDNLMIITLNDSLQLKNIGEFINKKDEVTGLIRVNNKLYLNYYNILNVYSSTDNGQSWQIDNNGIQPGLNAYQLFAIDSHVLIYAGNANSIRTEFYIKNGTQWEKYKSNGITISGGLVLDFEYSNSTLYTNVLFTKKLYYSNDLGRNWNLMNLDGLNNTFISTIRGITANKQGVFIGSYGDGLYKRDLFGKLTSIVLPLNKQLNIYPNPVNTKLNIDLENINNFRFEIYNLNGQLVLTGDYLDFIDVSKLTNGCYVLKLVSDEISYSKLIFKN